MAPSKDRICYFYDSDVGTSYWEQPPDEAAPDSR